MIRPLNKVRRFVESTHGLAAIEFAMILPIMLILVLATFDAGQAISVYIKVRSATAVLADISNQYKTIHDSDMQQILGATAVVLSPFPSSPTVVVLSQLSITSAGRGKVIWSDTLNGVARTVGTTITIPTGFTNVGGNIVYCEVSYRYSPSFGYFATGSIPLSDTLYTTPRSSASIARASP